MPHPSAANFSLVRKAAGVTAKTVMIQNGARKALTPTASILRGLGAGQRQSTSSGDSQQRWIFVPLGNCYYKIPNTFTHKALDVTNAASSNGALIQQWDDNGSLQQQWDIIPSDSYYQIVNRLSGKLLDVTNASASNGTPIQQWAFNGGLQQQWYVAP